MTDDELAAEFAVWADVAREWAAFTEAAAVESWDRAVGLRLVGGEQPPDPYAPIGAQHLHDIPDAPSPVPEVPVECRVCHLHPRIGHASDCSVGREQAEATVTDWDALKTPGRRR